MNYFYKKSKHLAVILSLVMIASLMSGFTNYQGIGEVLYSAEANIAQNAFYEEKISVNSSQAVIHSFTTNITETNPDIIPYVFVGDVVGKASLSYMKNLLKEEGYSVIAGINGDFYDTVTGTPIGMSVHGGKIINSGANYTNAIGFRSDGTAFVSKVLFDYTITVNGLTTFSFNHINKPRGASNSLHLFNEKYADSTRTTGSNVEVVLQSVDGIDPVINGTINAVVKSVTQSTNNTTINPGEMVLSASMDTTYAQSLIALIPGDNLALSVKDLIGNFNDTVEAIGAYEIIAQDGVIITQDKISNPRTCIGIKPDGNIILYAVDGRRPGHSVGMNLMDVATYLLERGCTTVVNMDGGGSTSMLARMPGDNDATLMNLPSDGRERNVSNALFIVTKTQEGGRASNLQLYPLSSYVMPGGKVEFITKANDENYFQANVPGDLNFDADSKLGSIDDHGVFTAAGVGTGDVTVSANGMQARSSVVVTDEVSINPDQTQILLDPGKSIDINIKAYHRYVPVTTNDNLFTWSCDSKVGSIDENGLFHATNYTGMSGTITVAYKDKKVTIPVQIGASRVSFLDTNEHWAKDYIEVLAAKGIVKGMGENVFEPDAQLTKAQFLTMLSNLVPNLDLGIYPDAGFTDVVPTEWYVPYVNWGYANKIILGNPDKTFGPNSPITREQMTVILNNFAKATSLEIEQKMDNIVFTDQGMVSPWAAIAVSKITKAKIMNGRPEGNFDPQGFASRAEASKVVFMFMNLIDEKGQSGQ